MSSLRRQFRDPLPISPATGPRGFTMGNVTSLKCQPRPSTSRDAGQEIRPLVGLEALGPNGQVKEIQKWLPRSEVDRYGLAFPAATGDRVNDFHTHRSERPHLSPSRSRLWTRVASPYLRNCRIVTKSLQNSAVSASTSGVGPRVLQLQCLEAGADHPRVESSTQCVYTPLQTRTIISVFREFLPST